MDNVIKGTESDIYKYLTSNLQIVNKPTDKKIKPPINYALTPLLQQIHEIKNTETKQGTIYYVKNQLLHEGEEVMESIKLERVNIHVIA